MEFADVYEDVGILAGTTDTGVPVVGILLPKEDPLHDDDCHEIIFTVTAAKALMVDLQDAINVAIEQSNHE